MMAMSGRVLICCVGLFLALTPASAVRKIKSINDLKKINFGQSVPNHSLLLLYWFVNTINIDNNNVMWLTFDPDDGDYGSHHYGNFEGMLDPLPYGHRYYTVGNLNQDTSEQLPSYILHPSPGYEGRNRDRIIFRVRDQNTERQTLRRIEVVYITQHYETSEQQGTRYDPENTYRITVTLLRDIRQFSTGRNQQSLLQLRNRFGSNADDSQLRNLRNIWGDLAGLGLLFFILIQEKHSSNQQKSKPQQAARRNTNHDFVVNIPENRQNHTHTVDLRYLQNQTDEIEIQVGTGIKGNARIYWKNIPRYRLKEEVMVVLFKNNEDQEASRTYKFIGNRASGSYDTSVPLNEGLQGRLHKVRRKCCFWRAVGEEICRGTEFKNPEVKVHIADYNARLQLFVKDGKACARLFVKKTFSEWRSEFNESWVGFYTSASKDTKGYEFWQWQWATKFKPSTDVEDFSYDVYEYHSSMAIAPGVQARFILRNEQVIAYTPCWQVMRITRDTHCR